MHALVDLARNLDIQAVAVGIETEEQLARVRRLRCSLGQGPLFSRPVDDKSTEQFLESDSHFQFAA